MTTTHRAYQGATAEARIQSRRQHLLEVAFEAMASDQWKAMSINQLCRLAELNKRYFYESFASLDELATAVIEDMSARLIHIAFSTADAGSQEGLSSLQIARRAMKPVVLYLTEDERRARVLFGEVGGIAAAREQRRRVIDGLAAAVSSYGLKHYDAGDKSDPMAELVSSFLVGGTIEAVLNWLDGGIAMTREQLMDDMATLWNVNGDAAAEIARKRS